MSEPQKLNDWIGDWLSDQELSALIEACNVTSKNQSLARPPWNTDGNSAWEKLLAEELRRGVRNSEMKKKASQKQEMPKPVEPKEELPLPCYCGAKTSQVIRECYKDFWICYCNSCGRDDCSGKGWTKARAIADYNRKQRAGDIKDS